MDAFITFRDIACAASVRCRSLKFNSLAIFICFIVVFCSYVTPWHGAGYDFARTFRSKFTYVSPVWYQLRGTGDSRPERSSFSLTGGHDFDEAWVSDVRNGAGGGRKGIGDTDVTKVLLVCVARVLLIGV